MPASKSSSIIPDNSHEIFNLSFPSGLKCTVSPGRSKEEKLIAITSKLVYPGLVITPDDDQVRFISECLEKTKVICVSVCLDNDPEENLEIINSFISSKADVLLIDSSTAENLPEFSCNYIIHWMLPVSVKDYVRDFRFLKKSSMEKYAVLLYDPADRYFQENIISLRYGSSKDIQKEMLADLDEMEEYAQTSLCRIHFLHKALGVEEPLKECGNCDNCRKSLAKQSLGDNDRETFTILLTCITETREKFGIQTLSDVIKGTKSGRITEYRLDRATTFGTLRDLKRKDIKQLFDRLIHLGYCKRTSGTYPSLYLTSLGKRFTGNIPFQVLELPKKMSVNQDEHLDMVLFEAVRNYRRGEAKLLNISAFMVFPDRVLKEIVKLQPQTQKELKTVKGFGEKSWDLCGEGLLKVVRRHRAETI